MGLKSRVQKIMMGRHPLGQPRSRRKTIDLTGNQQLSVRDSGAIFTTHGAASASNLAITLPPLADSAGCIYTFMVTTDLNLFSVASAEGNNMVSFQDIAATSFSYNEATDANNIGGACTLINDGTQWIVQTHLADDTQSTLVA